MGSELPEGFVLDEQPQEQPVTRQVQPQIQQPVQPTQQPSMQRPTPELPAGFVIDEAPPIEAKPVSPELAQTDKVNTVLDQLYKGHLPDNKQKALDELVKRGSLTGSTGEPLSISTLSTSLRNRLGKAEPIQEPEEELSLGTALYEGIKELPASAKKQVTSLWDAIKEPVKTWEGLKTIAKDMYKNQMEVAIRDMGWEPEDIKFKEGSILENIEQTPALDMIIDEYKDKYGTYAGFKKAIATDPAAVITDIASIAAPAAKGVQATATAAKLPKIAKVAETVGKAAALTEPVTLATMPVKKGAVALSKLTGKAFESLKPTGLYESATKMSTKISPKERKRLANVALESGIMPTIKGLEKLEKKITSIDSTIADMIEKSVSSGKTMPLGKLFKDFESLKAERLLSGKAKTGVKAIDNIRKGLLEANAKIKRGRLTPKEVQKLKQTIYKDLSGAYEGMKNSTASVKAQKAVARSAKEYLEELLPEIKQLNKTDSDLIKLRGAIEGPASRIRNHQLMGLGSGMKVTAGATSGGMIGGPETAALFSGLAATQAVFDHPKVKSYLAIVLDKLQKQGVKIPENRAISLLLTEQVTKKAAEAEKGEK